MLYKWLNDSQESRGSAKALVYRDTYLSWRGLADRVDRRAQELSGLGIKRGHWVGLMLGNVPDFAILALALSKIGATVVPLDPTTGPRDLQLILDHAPLRALITRPRGGVDATAATAPKASPVESRRQLQRTLLGCTVYKAPAVPAPAAAVVLFTNDSSGKPKGVLRQDAHLEAGAAQIQRALDVTADDRILTIVPLFSAYGFDFGFLQALRTGATLYLEDDVAASRIVKLLREQEINVLPGTPGLYAGLAKVATAKPLKMKRVRYVSGGSALPEATATAFRARLGQRVWPLFHTTEAGLIACDKKGGVAATVGKPVDGVETRLTAPPPERRDGHAGENGPDGEAEGESPIERHALWVRSEAVAPEFVGPSSRVGNVARAAGTTPIGQVDGEGWLRTGDVIRVDKAGRIFLVGREDRVVKVDGKRVALDEVRGCLESFSKVQSAEVRVIDDPLGGPLMVADVVLFEKCDAEELIDYCAKNLAPYKVPRRILFRRETPDTIT